jgi:hypothetical protein
MQYYLLQWSVRQRLLSLRLLSLLGVLSSLFKTSVELRLENLALRHQLGVLRRSAPKRLKLRPTDRILWVWLRRVWRDWRSALLIVKPETVIAWHRKGFRLYWTWRCGAGSRAPGCAAGGSGFDPDDESQQSNVGRSASGKGSAHPEASRKQRAKRLFQQSGYRKLLAAMPLELQLLLVFGYHLGMRKSALLQLKWKQVDFKAGLIYLERKKSAKNIPQAVPIYGDMRTFLEKQPRDSVYLFARGSEQIKDFGEPGRLPAKPLACRDCFFTICAAVPRGIFDGQASRRALR